MSHSDGIVDITDIREGDVLKKEDLNDTKDSWEGVENEVGEDNIREEGLDRRAFASNATWSDSLDSSSRCYYSGLTTSGVPGDSWDGMDFGTSGSDDIVMGGMNEVWPEIAFDWDPQVHTYVIIRASFWFTIDIGLMGATQRDNHEDEDTFDSDRDNQDFRFGIYISPPGGTFGDLDYSVRRIDNPNGGIFCPVQVGLNKSYSSDSTGTFNHIRHSFDRRSAIATTVSMVVGGQSMESDSAVDLNDNLYALDLREPGLVQARLAWRSHQSRTSCSHDEDFSGFSGQIVDAKYGRLQFFAQVFRR